MIKIIILSSLIFLLTGMPCHAVELTNTKGQSLEATILLRIGDKVKIQLQNGRQFTIPISSLNKESQDKIEEWQAKKIKKLPEPFRISIGTYRENKQKSNSVSTNLQTYDSGYNVTVTNRTPMKMDDIRIEYILVMEEEIAGARSNSNAGMRSVKGEEKLKPMAQGRSVEFQTKTLSLRESKLKPNWSYASGGRENATDELKGIWIKFYVGKTLVYEFSRPSNLAGSFKWDRPPNEQ